MSYAAGEEFLIKVANTTTGTGATINVQGLGAKTLLLQGGGSIQAGDLVAGEIIAVVYDGTNFQLTTPISQSIIDTALTITIQTGIYADLNAVNNWLSRRKIDARGSVTISFPAGSYSYSTSQTLEHPQGDKITLTGGTVTSPPTGANASFTTLSSAFSTQVTFSGATGFVFKGNIGMVQNIMAIGAAGNSGTGFAFTNSIANTFQIAACKFGVSGISMTRSLIYTGTTYACANVGIGVNVNFTSWQFGGALGVNSNGTTGVEVGNDSSIFADTANIGVMAANGNTGTGVYVFNSTGNLNGGSGGQIKNNGLGGLEVLGGSNISAPTFTFSGNSGYAWLYNQSSGLLNNCTATGSSGQQGSAAFGSNVYFSGSTYDGSFTPALNTNGNGNSFITY